MVKCAICIPYFGGGGEWLRKAKKGGKWSGVEGGKERASKCKGMQSLLVRNLKYKRETHEMGVERKKESK